MATFSLSIYPPPNLKAFEVCSYYFAMELLEDNKGVSVFKVHQKKKKEERCELIPILIISTISSNIGTIDVQWSWQTIVMGFGFLLFLLATRHIVSVQKPLFRI